MKSYFEISQTVTEKSETALANIKEQLDIIEKIGEINQQKVLAAFIKNRVAEITVCDSNNI